MSGKILKKNGRVLNPNVFDDASESLRLGRELEKADGTFKGGLERLSTKFRHNNNCDSLIGSCNTIVAIRYKSQTRTRFQAGEGGLCM